MPDHCPGATAVGQRPALPDLVRRQPGCALRLPERQRLATRHWPRIVDRRTRQPAPRRSRTLRHASRGFSGGNRSPARIRHAILDLARHAGPGHHGPADEMSGFKQPVSVLVVIYTAALDVLLLERSAHPGFWQSVTGSREGDEVLIDT